VAELITAGAITVRFGKDMLPIWMGEKMSIW